MMLSTERELLVHLALRVLEQEEEWLEFYLHHYPDGHALTKDGQTRVAGLRKMIEALPYGSDYLNKYDQPKG